VAQASESAKLMCPLWIKGLLKSRREQLVDSMDNLEGEEREKVLEGDLVVQMLKVLRELQDDATSDPFWEPVDEEYYTDYGDVVDEPMDLGSIARRVSVGFYAHPEEFAEDVRKVWSNCQLYNDESLEIHANSKSLGRYFEEMLAQIRPSSKETSAEEEQPAEEEVKQPAEEEVEVKKVADDNELVESVSGADGAPSTTTTTDMEVDVTQPTAE